MARPVGARETVGYRTNSPRPRRGTHGKGCTRPDCSLSSAAGCARGLNTLNRKRSMCGIVGYVGPRLASPLLVEGLKRLEYRGYDSAGVAIMNGAGVETVKEAGKISRLEAMLAAKPIQGTTGIAHTRWA